MLKALRKRDFVVDVAHTFSYRIALRLLVAFPSDSMLEWGGTIIVKLTALCPVLAEEGKFALEVTPTDGSMLHISRKPPNVIGAIMDLK